MGYMSTFMSLMCDAINVTADVTEVICNSVDVTSKRCDNLNVIREEKIIKRSFS